MARSDKPKAKPKEKRKGRKGDNQIVPPPPPSLPSANPYGDTVSCSNPFDDNNSTYLPRQMPPQAPGPSQMGQQLPPPMGMNQPPGGNPMGMGYQPGPLPNQGPPMRMPLAVNQSPTHPNQMRYNNPGKPPSMGPGGPPMQSTSPGHSGYGAPLQSPSPGQHGGYGGPPNAPPPRPMGDMPGMIYSGDQPLIRNSQNQNAPPIYTCGGCRREIAENEAALLCESGCNFWYHKQCSGLNDDAYNMIKADFLVEWACDGCVARGNVPLFKFKP